MVRLNDTELSIDRMLVCYIYYDKEAEVEV